MQMQYFKPEFISLKNDSVLNEYWDIERRRYPQYDHCAVLIAEDITSRFLNGGFPNVVEGWW